MALDDVVLVVTEDAELLDATYSSLDQHELHVFDFEDVAAARRVIRASDAPVVITDGKLTGTALAGLRSELDESGRGHLIVVVDRDDAGIDWLDRGASDFVTKPVDGRLLEARVRARMRPSAAPPAGRLEFDGLVIDPTERRVAVGGAVIDLTKREFDLVAFLAANPDTAFSREELLQEVWKSSSRWQDPRTVTEHVYRIRHKLRPEGAGPRWIVTVRGGYRFAARPDAIGQIE